MQEIQPAFGIGYWHISLLVQRKLKHKMTHQNLTGDSTLAAQSECSICRNLESLLLDPLPLLFPYYKASQDLGLDLQDLGT